MAGHDSASEYYLHLPKLQLLERFACSLPTDLEGTRSQRPVYSRDKVLCLQHIRILTVARAEARRHSYQQRVLFGLQEGSTVTMSLLELSGGIGASLLQHQVHKASKSGKNVHLSKSSKEPVRVLSPTARQDGEVPRRLALSAPSRMREGKQTTALSRLTMCV